jgi:hypothetical protein
VLGERTVGFTEVGGFMGFAGVFILVVARALSKANLYPKQHPFLEECLEHHV